MDLSAGRRRGPLTQEERMRRISQGLCLYCGGAGHIAVACPNRRPVRAAAVVVTSPVTTEMEVRKERERERREEEEDRTRSKN
jgi:phage/plasmid primase-like uncharacterized protein